MRITMLFVCLAAFSIGAHASSTNDEVRKADEALNATYQRVMGGVPNHQKAALRNAQRAWIAFRDGACIFESSMKYSSSRDWVSHETRPVQDNLCIQRLTLERLAHLQHYTDLLSKGELPSESQISKQIQSCSLGKLPADFTVQAIGVYKGEIDTDVQLDTSGHETKSVEVIVNRPNENVVVVLMANEPVLWKIKRTPDSKIVGVIVGGHLSQAVIGIDRSVPLLISTNRGRKDCSQGFYAYKAGRELREANAIIKGITGREIDLLWSNHQGGRVHIGTPPFAKANLISSTDFSPEDYTNLPRFPSGQKGIERLIELGLLRRALPTDLDVWVERASAQYKKFNPNLKFDRPSGSQGEYVVLGKMTFPTGLYGAHSVAFFISPGIPFPDGNPGHSSIYFLEDGTCRGPTCPRP